MFTANREQLAWAAGFFDGEGHIGVVTPKSGNAHIHIQVVQTEEGPLQRLQTVLNVGRIYGPYNHGGNRRPYKQLHIDRFESVQHTVCALWPWLSAPKKRQIVAAFDKFALYLSRPHKKRGPKPRQEAA